jgi:hypothetical protein
MIHNVSTRSCIFASLVFATVCLLALPLFAFQVSDTHGDRSIDQLISQLSDPLPANREKAEAAILAFGDAALPAIKRGLQEGSLEIHDRCQILRQRIVRRKRERVSKQFLDPDTTAKNLAQFEAWPHFSAFAGNDDVSHRELFLEMCDSIPSIFEDYGFKSELSATALKNSARMTLVPDRHYTASASVLTVAYLFLADLAAKKHSESSSLEPLFKDVEILEAVNFISNPDNSHIVRTGSYRSIIEVAAANWIEKESVRERLPSDLKWNLIFQTQNPVLIERLAASYDSFSVSEKLKFLDVLSVLASEDSDNASATCIKLLAKPMKDETKVLDSRYRKRPAQMLEVRARMLAEAIATKALSRGSTETKKIKLEKIFGDFPLSGAGYSVLNGGESREMLSQQLLSRKQSQ